MAEGALLDSRGLGTSHGQTPMSEASPGPRALWDLLHPWAEAGARSQWGILLPLGGGGPTMRTAPPPPHPVTVLGRTEKWVTLNDSVCQAEAAFL